MSYLVYILVHVLLTCEYGSNHSQVGRVNDIIKMVKTIYYYWQTSLNDNSIPSVSGKPPIRSGPL